MMTIRMIFHLRLAGQAIGLLARASLVVMLIATATLAGLVGWYGAQPLGAVGEGGRTAVLDDISYWEFMAGSLAASRETPANCHRMRLIGLAIGLPLYPMMYTAIALYPESALARHAQPSPLIPAPIGWREAPATWWRLVKEISWLMMTEPQRDFTPAVGERVRVDERCTLPAR
jgi:hypothetical protein